MKGEKQVSFLSAFLTSLNRVMQIDDEISYLKLDTKVRREFMLMEARLLDERREGIAEGEANANIATAKRLFSMGLSVQDIAKATSLPIEQVEALQAEQQP